MDRRSFLKNTTLGGSAAAAASLAAPAYAQGNRKLTMVTTWGRGLAGVFDAAQRVADSVNAMADGQLTIEVKGAGELVGAFEVFDAVTAGQADMYHGADYYFVGQHPSYAFFTSVPFGMTAQELANWYYHDGGAGFHDELGQIFGLKSFLAGNTGAQAGGWFSKEINGPEDFNGLKFRMPGLGGKALGKLGASVQNLPGAEVYQIYYTAGFHEPGAGLSVGVNRDTFMDLTAPQQKIVEIACAEAHQWNLAQFLSNNGAALQRLQSSGVQTREFPNSVWDAFGEAADAVHQENMGDDIYKRIYDSYTASLESSSEWIQKSDGVYTAQRNRVLG